MRSRLSRRSNVILSAAGEGLRLSFSSRARMNRSIGFTGQRLFFVPGRSGRAGALKAQCWVGGSIDAPGTGVAELPRTENNSRDTNGRKLRTGDLNLACTSVIYARFGR